MVVGSAAAAATATLPLKASAQATEPAALFVLFLRGGFNGVFNGPDAYLNVPAGRPRFGVTQGNVKNLGNGLFVDKDTLGALSPFALGHMATIGAQHNETAHDRAQLVTMHGPDSSHYCVRMAAAFNEQSPFPLIQVGSQTLVGPRAVEGNLSMQMLTDMKVALAALSPTATGALTSRAAIGQGLTAAKRLSTPLLTKHPRSLASYGDAADSMTDALVKPPFDFSLDELTAAYNLPAGTGAVRDLTEKFAAAEMMIRAGTRVVLAVDDGPAGGNWDTHGSTDAQVDRNQFAAHVMPGLSTFVSRMVGQSNSNVVVAIMGDFTRTLPGSDHGTGVAGTVIGKYVKTGTTGRSYVRESGGLVRSDLPDGTPGMTAFWAYLADVLRLPNNPFGRHPHQLVLS